MSIRIMAAIGLATVLLPGLARAELTAFWRHNPITPSAIANDPTLAGMHSWSLMVTNTHGNFAGAGLRAELPSGHSYYRNPSVTSNFRPSLDEIAASPALAFSTYVTQPRQSVTSPTAGSPSVFGGFPEGSQESFGGSTDPLPGVFSVSWGNPQDLNQLPGTFELARLTFSTDVLPTVMSHSLINYTPDQTVLIPTTIPEPVSSAVFIGSVFVHFALMGARRCARRMEGTNCLNHSLGSTMVCRDRD